MWERNSNPRPWKVKRKTSRATDDLSSMSREKRHCSCPLKRSSSYTGHRVTNKEKKKRTSPTTNGTTASGCSKVDKAKPGHVVLATKKRKYLKLGKLDQDLPCTKNGYRRRKKKREWKKGRSVPGKTKERKKKQERGPRSKVRRNREDCASEN